MESTSISSLGCHSVTALEIARTFKEQLIKTVKEQKFIPKMVAFLANEDPFAHQYAKWTEKSCREIGIDFQLVVIKRNELEEKIIEANENKEIHGIMVYYPCFGDPQDQYIQNLVDKTKDVEGLCHTYKFNMYHNIRFIDKEKVKKCIIPCTPLAIVKVMEHIGIYNKILKNGKQLHGKTICIINRSEIVGRPLAALLANDGARVFSVDINGIQEFTRGAGLALKMHDVKECSMSLNEILAFSDVVITGVPSPKYKVDTSLLKEGVVAINFASDNNFNEDIKMKASIYVASVGKVTVAMLQRNLLRLAEYQMSG